MDVPERVILTNMCMIQSGSKVLVEDKVSEWDCGITFPGGHVEPQEPIAVLCGIKEWINEDRSRYIVFLFRADCFSGELVSSDEGRVFWAEKEEILKMNWIWHLDGILKVMEPDGPAELYLDSAEDWKPVLK